MARLEKMKWDQPFAEVLIDFSCAWMASKRVIWDLPHENFCTTSSIKQILVKCYMDTCQCSARHSCNDGTTWSDHALFWLSLIIIL